MSEQIRQIAMRVKELRQISGLSITELAAALGADPAIYETYESGEIDIPASFLLNLANYYGVELTAILTGGDARLRVYALTRAGEGISVERRREYKYQHLAYNFLHKKAEPFLVTVDPGEPDAQISLNSHPGQEFDYVLEGRLRLVIGGKELVLKPGDSLYYDSNSPHGMQAMDGQAVKFLAIIF